MTVDPLLPPLACAAGGALLGWLLTRAVSRQDHLTWVLARAPALPIRSLAVGDDAWVRGTVHADRPLVCPHFDEECVSYSYTIEREHTWTTTDKDGKVQVHTEWRQEHSASETIDFELDDGDRITVRADGATNEAEHGLETDYETSTLRHSASVLGIGEEISVLGVKQDDGSLSCEREVPCLWTHQSRAKRVAASAGSENWLSFFACLFPFLGGAGAVLWYFGSARDLVWVDAAWAALGGLALMLPFWSIGAWNRLVRLRHQVGAAFRQVDVDLAVRSDLVPNLVTTIKAYAAHEAQVLQSLGAIRSGRDRQGEAAVRGVLLLHEKYPALQADSLYRDLHDRLWALEEKLAHTRQLYNDIATEWNDRIAKFPQGLVARFMRCRPAPLFAGDDAQLPPRLVD